MQNGGGRAQTLPYCHLVDLLKKCGCRVEWIVKRNAACVERNSDMHKDISSMRWRWNHTLMVLCCLPIWVIAWHFVGGVIYYLLRRYL